LVVKQLVHGDVGTAAGPGAGDNVGTAATLDLAGRDADAAREVNVIREEAEQRVWRAERGDVAAPFENRDVGTTAGVGAADDVSGAIAVHAAGRNVDAAGEMHVVGEKAGQHRAVQPADHGNIGTAAGSGAADNVWIAVAVDVANGHTDAAGE